MFCPQCNAEYRPGFTRCADCDVDLISEPSQYALAGQPPTDPGDPNEDPFCSFWKGEDARVHAELCEVLEEAGIPHKTVFRRDHLFNLSNFPGYQEDATASVWSTDAGEPSDFLVAALHENGINCRVDQHGICAKLYVLPDDATRAREIVREVAEGQPPE